MITAEGEPGQQGGQWGGPGAAERRRPRTDETDCVGLAGPPEDLAFRYVTNRQPPEDSGQCSDKAPCHTVKA